MPEATATPAPEKHPYLSFAPIEGGVKVTACDDDVTEAVVPETFSGEAVVSIGEKAFRGLDKLETVQLPDGLARIEAKAFADCPALKEIKVPESVDKIAENAFDGCPAIALKCVRGSFAYDFAQAHGLLPEQAQPSEQPAEEPPVAEQPMPEPPAMDSSAEESSVAKPSAEELPTEPLVVQPLEDGVLEDGVVRFQVTAGGPGEIGYQWERRAGQADEGGWEALDGAMEPVLEQDAASAEEDIYRCVVTADDQTVVTNEATYTSRESVLSRAYASPFYYQLNAGGSTVTITGYTGNEAQLVIPPTIDGYRVTGIGYRAFRYCATLSSVELPSGLKIIDEYGFEGSSLVSIVLPDTLQTISNGAFYDCINLTSIAVPDSVTSIGGGVFYNCNMLETAVLPKGLETISNSLFDECRSLKSVTLPSAPKTIAPRAFRGTALTAMVIPQSVSSIGNDAFCYCRSLRELTLPKSITTIPYRGFAECSNLQSVSIPDSVSLIDTQAFLNCSSLQAVTFPAGLTTINGQAFGNCAKLEKAILPEGLTTIGRYAFWGCSSLNELTLPKSLTQINQGSFGLCAMTTLTVPGSVGVIPESAFNSCGKLQTLVLEEGITQIDYNAFHCAVNLTSVRFPSTLKTIGRYAFDICSVLSDLQLPENLETIEEGAFMSCRGLTGVRLPDSLTSLGIYAFGQCDAMRLVSIGSKLTSFSLNAFYASYGIESILLHADSVAISDLEGVGSFGSLTFYVLPGSNAERYMEDHGLRYDFLEAMKENCALDVTLKPEQADADYTGFTLTLTDEGNGAKLSTLLTSEMKYAFYGLSEDSRYTVRLSNSYGTVLAEATGITPAIGETELELPVKTAIGSLEVRLYDESRRDVSDQANYQWYDGDGKLLGSDQAILGLVSGQAVTCNVTLGAQLADRYAAPPQKDLVVAAGSDYVEIQLTPFEKMTIRGTIRDEKTGLALPGVAVTAARKESRAMQSAFTTRSDGFGAFALEVPDTALTLYFSADGYQTKTVSADSPKATADLGAISLSLISGAKVQLDITYMASVQGSGSAFRLSDWSDLAFSVQNMTSSAPVREILVQSGALFALDSTAPGDILRITVQSRSHDFTDTYAEVTLSPERSATAKLVLVQHGRARATATESGNAADRLLIYDAGGALAGAADFSNGTALSPCLADGGYTLVAIGASSFFNRISRLSDLSSAGLAVGTDYVLQQVTISTGAVSNVNFARIPALDENRFYYADTAFTLSKSEVTAGRYVSFKGQATLREAYAGGQNLYWEFSLPAGLSIVPNTVSVGGGAAAYQISSGRMTVSVSKATDVVRFSVVPVKPGNYDIAASLSFEMGGARYLQPARSIALTVNDVSLNVPEKTNRTTETAYGAAYPRATVRLYDNGSLVGETTANDAGEWRLSFDLCQPFTFTRHELSAEIIAITGEKIRSASKTMVFNRNSVSVLRVTMVNTAHGEECTTVFDFASPNPKAAAYQFDPRTPTISFFIDFDGTVDRCALDVRTTSGETVSLTPEFDAQKNLWFATADFTVNSMPVSVAVRYDSAEEFVYDRESVAAMVAEVEAAGAEDAEKAQTLEVLLAQADALMNADPVDQGALDAVLAQIDSHYNTVETDFDEVSYRAFLETLDTDEEFTAYLDQMLSDFEAEIGAFSDELRQSTIDNGFDPDTYAYVNVETPCDAKTSDCAGLTPGGLMADGYKALPTSNGASVYYRQTEKSIDFVDFESNTHCTLSKAELLDALQLRATSDGGLVPKAGLTWEDAEKALDNASEKVSIAYSLAKEYARDQLVKDTEIAEGVSKRTKFLNEMLESAKNYRPHLVAPRLIEISKQRIASAEAFEKIAKHRSSFMKISKLAAIGDIASTIGLILSGMKIREWSEACESLDDTLTQKMGKCTNVYDYQAGESIRADIELLELKIVGHALFLAGMFVATGVAGLGTGLLGAAAVIAAQLLESKLFEDYVVKTLRQIQTDINNLPCGEPGATLGFGQKQYFMGPDRTAISDPSGYVYEAVASNRLEGATATCYQKVTKLDAYDEPYQVEEEWDAEAFGQQNRQKTDAEGRYGWDVPQGLWQIRFEKAGYQPVRSEWMEVPPPRFDVNVGMVSYAQPAVSEATAFPGEVNIHFSKYMRVLQLTKKNIQFKVDGAAVAGEIEIPDSEANPANPAESFASRVRFIPQDSLSVGSSVTVTVSTAVKSYADVAMNKAYSQQLTVNARPESLSADAQLKLDYGASGVIALQATPAEAASGKAVTVSAITSTLFSVQEQSAVFDQGGRATVHVQALLPGESAVRFQLEGSDLTAETTVIVSLPSKSGMNVAKPAAAPAGGQVDYGTPVQLSCSTPGATIYYTLDGSCPCEEETRLTYTQPIAIRETGTLLTMAEKDGMEDSAVAKYEYTVDQSLASAIALKARSHFLGIGGNMAIEASVTPEGADPTVVWSTSNQNIATVDGNGNVFGMKAGKCKITATAADGGGASASFDVTVGKYVTSIAITGTGALGSGRSATLKATALPKSAPKRTLKWASSSPAIATVTSGGVVKARSVASATPVTITAIAADGSGVTASHTMTIYPVVTAVNILTPKKYIDFTAQEKTLTLSASCMPGNALQDASWKSGNTKIATVDDTGMITALRLGTVTITATAKDGSGKSAKVAIAVVNAIKGLSIHGAAALASGKSAQLSLSVSPSNASNRGVIWSNDNTAAATVDKGGKVTAKKVSTVETVVITATALENPEVTATHTMTIRPIVASVTLEASSRTIDFLAQDKTLQLSASCVPGNALQDVSWKSSSTKIATVDATGKVTALRLGTVTITATAMDGSGKSAKVTISVVNAVKSLAITGALALYAGKTAQLGLTFTPVNATNKGVKWSSSNVAAAKVDSRGKVTAGKVKSTETVIITAVSVENPSIFSTHAITVYPTGTKP